MELYFTMPVRIHFNDDLVFEFDDDRVEALHTLRALCMFSKFNLDRRDLTLDSEVIIRLIKSIDKFLIEKSNSELNSEGAQISNLSNPPEIDDYLLREIIEFCRGSDPDNEKYNAYENTESFLKKAIFPFEVSPLKLDNAVKEVMDNQRNFDYSAED